MCVSCLKLPRAVLLKPLAQTLLALQYRCSSFVDASAATWQTSCASASSSWRRRRRVSPSRPGARRRRRRAALKRAPARALVQQPHPFAHNFQPHSLVRILVRIVGGLIVGVRMHAHNLFCTRGIVFTFIYAYVPVFGYDTRICILRMYT